MTADDYAPLERELFDLGKRELALEESLRTLRQASRAHGLAGRHDVADRAWSLLEKNRDELAALQARIRKLEAKIYSCRRR